jgi:D-alanyl-lipoteichoic acid acyltransferase DltB (MBOAT superfamily)
MVFNSLQFLLFFGAIYSIYIALTPRAQNRLLLISSYIFYGAWDYRLAALLLLSTTIDYFSGIGISGNTHRVRKVLMVSNIVWHLGVLSYFKYYNFFAQSLGELFSVVGVPVSFSALDVVLPLGISFYTFASMSYTIDIYRGHLEPCRNFLDLALFVSFFPALVSGPIGRGQLLLPQIAERRTISSEKFCEGFFLIIWGLYKKLVIADNLNTTVNEVFSKTQGFGSGEVFIGTLFFTFQIYADFSGYTDIARGISRLMGFELMLNFNLPYFARNPSDFWRRWHISLSRWLRDYLYIPLGGNRGGEVKTHRNLMTTMAIGGLWHGAAWNFVLWGLYHGLLLSMHRFLHLIGVLDEGRQHGIIAAKAIRYCSVCLMFCFTLYGWLLFRANGLRQIANMTISLADITPNEFVLGELAKLAFYLWPLAVIQFWQSWCSDLYVVVKSPVCAQVITYTLLLLLIVILGNFDGASFIYFQF